MNRPPNRLAIVAGFSGSVFSQSKDPELGLLLAIEAAEKAISHPLLEDISVSGARGVLMNITASSAMEFEEVAEASERIHREVGDEAEIFWGTSVDESLGDEMRVTVIATGIGAEAEAVRPVEREREKAREAERKVVQPLRGKVRDVYAVDDRHMLIVTTDRLSAFDRVLATVPFKGQVLNQLSTWWFERTADIIPNHAMSQPDPNALLALVHPGHAGTGFAYPVVDDDIGLEPTNILVEIPPARVRPRRFPFPVEPQNTDRAVAREQLLELALHVSDVASHIGRCGRGFVVPRAARAPIGMVPIHNRMVEAHLDPRFRAGVGQLLERVALERRALGAPVGQLGAEHAEPVVVLAGDDDVLHARIFGDAHPLPGIEVHRVEGFLQQMVFLLEEVARR